MVHWHTNKFFLIFFCCCCSWPPVESAEKNKERHQPIILQHLEEVVKRHTGSTAPLNGQKAKNKEKDIELAINVHTQK